MKLGEALNKRAALAKRINHLRDLAGSSVVVRTDEEPAVEALQIHDEILSTIREIETLVARINLTNAATTINGSTITSVLAYRDSLGAQIAQYDWLIARAATEPLGYGYGRGEAPTRRTVDVAPLSSAREQLIAAKAELETNLQAANWTTDLQ